MTARNEFTAEQEQWLAALESGDWEQASQWLCLEHSNGGMAYCCLGVATVVINPSHEALEDPEVFDNEAPEDVQHALFLQDGGALFAEGAPLLHGERSLIGANDYGGATFSEIAAYIRKYPWAVFANFGAPEDVA